MRHRKTAQILAQPLGIPVFPGKVRPEGNHRLPRGSHEIIQFLAFSRPRPHVAGKRDSPKTRNSGTAMYGSTSRESPHAIDACGVREIITA